MVDARHRLIRPSIPIVVRPRAALLAKLPTIEVEAVAPAGAAGWRRFRLARQWGAVGYGRANGLRLAARHTLTVAVQYFGSDASLGDTTSTPLLLAQSAFLYADPSTAGLEVLEQFWCRAVGYLSPVRPHGKILNGLTQRGCLPVRVNWREIAAEPTKLGLDRDNELALSHCRRRTWIDRGHLWALRFATRRHGEGARNPVSSLRRKGLGLLGQRCNARLRLAPGLFDRCNLLVFGTRVRGRDTRPNR